MLKVTYDKKPLPPNIDRVRLNVIDSFINEEQILLSEKVKQLLASGCSKASIKRYYDRETLNLDKELEKKRRFMILLRSTLSWRKPEAIAFIKQLNEDNKMIVRKMIF